MSHSKDNLVLHLKLDEIIEDGNTKKVIDISEKAHDCEFKGNPQVVQDETFGSCLSLDGTDDYVSCDNINLAKSSFTLALWAKQESATQRWDLVLGQGANKINQGLHLGFRSNQKFTFGFYSNDLDTPAYTDTDWHHYACVCDYDSKADKSSRVIYRDGENVAEDRDKSPYQGTGDLFIGHSLVFNSFFRGKIAHVRIYNQALSPEEIQQDRQEDLSAISSFNQTHPLDFNLYEGEDKEPVLFIENGTRAQELVLEIVNHSDRPIRLPAKRGAVSEANHHFELRFRPDTLSLASPKPLVLAEKTGWSMSSPVTQANGMVSLYLLATNNQSLEANKTVSLTLQQINGAAAGGARTTRVELRCPQFTYHGETLEQYYREKRLSIISHRGKKHIPLHVGFVRSNRILNDWKTDKENPDGGTGSENELILRITNVLKDKAIPFKPKSKGDEASKFIISFDVDDYWALAEKSQVENILIEGKDWRPNEKPEEDWHIDPNTAGGTPTWTITHQNEEEAGLAPGQVVQLTIRNIVSSLPSGQANLYLRYENIPGYWDGTFVCTIEKSPILYNKDGNVGIWTTHPEAKLSINGGLHVGGDSDPGDNNLLVDGKTTTNQLFVTGNVGIGTKTPKAKLSINGGLHIGGDSDPGDNNLLVEGSLSFPLNSNRQSINLSGSNYGIGIQNNTQYFRTVSNFAWYRGGKHDDDELKVGADGHVQMVINSSGNVGIGTTNPGQKLVVSSDFNIGKHDKSGMEHGGSLAIVSNAPQIDFINTDGNDWSIHVHRKKMFFIRQPWHRHDLVLDGEGNVGIGTEKPAAKLEVKGVVRAKTFESTNPYRHRMYPADPIYYPTKQIKGKGEYNFYTSGRYDTIWARVPGDRWTTIQVDAQGKSLGKWVGGNRRANCYCPDGSLSDRDSRDYQWLPIPIGGAKRLTLSFENAPSDVVCVFEIAYSQNPWKHAAQSARAYHLASNGGDKTSWDNDRWKDDVVGKIDRDTTLTLKVPVVPSKRDKLLYLIEYNNYKNGCMHTSISVNDQQIERFIATYDNPFARHWNSKSYNRYIAARIPAHLVQDDAQYLDVIINMKNQNDDIHFREIGTHDLEVPIYAGK